FRSHRRPLLPSCLVLILGFTVLTWEASAAEPAGPDEKEPPSASHVQVIHDLAYRDLYEGEDGSQDKNKLDLYIPRGKKDYPIIFFVHGGAWLHGNKNQFGMYGALAVAWARHGIGTVSINYRLSPGVQHPEHIKDVARAFAWTPEGPIARQAHKPVSLG